MAKFFREQSSPIRLTRIPLARRTATRTGVQQIIVLYSRDCDTASWADGLPVVCHVIPAGPRSPTGPKMQTVPLNGVVDCVVRNAYNKLIEKQQVYFQFLLELNPCIFLLE